MGTEMETSGNRTALGVTADIAQQVGARLRKARESIGRSTSALSAKIKVREHYLVAIEEGDWNELPPGLNGRGLVRIYARELSVSVPELDQAANQTVMPAEQVAQAPYQITGSKKDHSASAADRDIPVVRVSHVDPAHVPSAPVRAVETGKTNTLNAPAARAARVSQESASRPQGTSVSGYRLIESTPEEAPLDVVTPDVASILGISLETIDQAQQPSNLAVVTPESKRASKSVSVEPKLKGSAAKRRKSEDSDAADAEAVLVVPADSSAPAVAPHADAAAVEAAAVAPHVDAAAVEAAAVAPHVDAAAVETEMVEQVVAQTAVVPETLPVVSEPVISDTESRSAPMSAETNVAAGSNESQVEYSEPVKVEASEKTSDLQGGQLPPLSDVQTDVSSQSAGVSAAEAYLRTHTHQAESSEEKQSEPTGINGSRGMTIALAVLAACAVVLVIGRVMTSTPPAEDTKSAETAAVEPAAKSETQSSAQQAGNDKPENAPSQESGQAAAPVPNSERLAAAAVEPTTPTAAAPSAPETAKANLTNSAITTSAPVTEATADSATATAPNQEAEETPVATPANKTISAGTKSAVLTLSEPIEIQVTSDGQRVFSGRQNAGKVNIKFNKRAEIFVQDGSKAQLNYAGWNHGALGQAGRKRRIVLNAEPFASE
jgi:hypothetical protein